MVRSTSGGPSRAERCFSFGGMGVLTPEVPVIDGRGSSYADSPTLRRTARQTRSSLATSSHRGRL